MKRKLEAQAFRATPAASASSLVDAAELPAQNARPRVLMPWVGFGTYRLGATNACSAVAAALRQGYRMIDTAYMYAMPPHL